MAENRKVQLGITVDSTEAKQELGEIKDAARDMAQSVSQAGEQAGKGLEKTSAAASGVADLIKRATAETSSGSKSVLSWREVHDTAVAGASADWKAYKEAVKNGTAPATDGLRTWKEFHDGAISAASKQWALYKESVKGAAAGIEAVAAGGDQAAQRVDRGTRSIIASIQRTTAAMEAGGKANSQYFEAIASQRGLNVDALRPYLTQLDAAVAKNTAMNQSLHGTTITTKQLEQALRGVPAQFTDIFTSLAAGQNPMMVFLQQGGQLKDMFGGMGPAAKALGGYVVGLINPFTLAAAAAGALAVAYYQGSKEADAYNKALVMTGNAAGTTADQLADMAERISGNVGTQGQAAKALAEMAATGRIAAGNIEYFGEVAVKAEKALGISTEQMAQDLAKLGKEPLKASEELNEKFRYLTGTIYDQIKALEEQGRKEEAAAVAQKAFADALSQRSDQIVERLGYVERAWNGVAGAAKDAWDSFLGVGRPVSPEEEIDAQRRIVEQLEKATRQRSMLGGGEVGFGADANLRTARERLKALEDELAAKRKNAEIDAENIRLNESYMSRQREVEEFKGRTAKRDQEMIRAAVQDRALIEKGLIQEEDLRKRLLAIVDKYAEKGGAGASSLKKTVDEAQKLAAAGVELAASLTAQDAGLSGDFQKKWDSLSAAYKAGALSIEDLTAAQAALLEQQPGMKSAAAAQKKSDEEAAKAAQARADAMRAALSAEQARAYSLQAGVDQMKEELITLGMSKRELAEYGAEKLRTAAKAEALAASNLEEAASTAEAAGAAKDAVEYYRNLAKARRDAAAALYEKAEVTAATGAKQAAIDAAEAADREWQRTAQSIEQSLTDALMRGFEEGEGFAENFRKTLINMFKTLILRPIIQPIAQGMSSMVMNAVGMGPSGGGVGGVSNAFSLANSGYGAYTVGSQYFSGTMSGANAAGTLYANATGGGLDGLLATNGAYGTAPAAGGFSLAGAGGAGLGMYAGYQLTGGNYGGAALGGIAGYGAASGLASGAGAYAGMTSALASIPVWGWVAIAALALLSSNMGGGTPHLGAATFTDFDDSQRQLKHEEQIGDETVWGGFKGSDGLVDPLNTFALGIVKTLEGTFANFGLDDQVSAFAAFGADDDDPSRGILRLFGEDGSILAQNTGPGNMHRGVKFDDDPQKGFEQFVESSGAVLRDALVAADLPGWVDEILTDLGDAPGLALVNQTIAGINAIQDAAERLGPYLGITAEGLASVADATGSFDQALTLLGQFADLSLTAAEKWEIQQKDLVAGFNSIGVAVPKSTAEFEALVGTIDDDLLPGLLQLAPAFYSIATAVEEAFASIAKSTADLVTKFQLDVMTDAERYAYFDSQIDILDAKIDAATDPAELKALIDERNQALMSAWNLLSDEQQRILLPEFTDIAMDGEASAQARLSITPIDDAKESERADQAATKTAAAVKQGVTEAMVPLLEQIATGIGIVGGNGEQAANYLREIAASMRNNSGSYYVSGREVDYA